MDKTVKQILCYILVLSVGMSCRNEVSTNVSQDQIEDVLQQLIDESVHGSFDAIPGTSLTVIAPNHNVNWSGVSGFDSKEKKDSFKLNQPFRIASVSKTFVAATILRLHEMDSLNIDDLIADYISAEHLKLIEQAGYNTELITIRHCLNHTSGLRDYVLGSKTFLDMVVANPQKHWTRTEQLEIAMTTGQKMGEVGELYSYCDTGYILLGEAIESLTDTTLAASLRMLLDYKKLGLNSTWLESEEPAMIDTMDIAHCYLGRNDATEWNASIDTYGGGGLVSITQDLALFMHKLMNNEVFQDAKTKDLMLSETIFLDKEKAIAATDYQDYRLGVGAGEVFGQKGYMHEGFWGSFMIYIPAYDCAIAGYTQDRSHIRLLKKVWLVLKNTSTQD